MDSNELMKDLKHLMSEYETLKKKKKRHDIVLRRNKEEMDNLGNEIAELYGELGLDEKVEHGDVAVQISTKSKAVTKKGFKVESLIDAGFPELVRYSLSVSGLKVIQENPDKAKELKSLGVSLKQEKTVVVK